MSLPNSTKPGGTGLPRGLMFLFALTTGAAAANFNYAQPLLHALAVQFHTTNSTAALIIVCSQGGYALGLLFLLPLGDLMKRKWLICISLGVDTLALVALSFSSNIIEFEIISILVGLSSVVAQIIIPLAADMADPSKTGKSVGTVTSGLLIGLLLARAFSGIVADAFGFAAVYRIAAMIMGTLTILMLIHLPNIEPRSPESNYRTILTSTLQLFLTQPLLKRRSVYGGLAFASFSMFWASLTFYLSGPAYHYSTTKIGLFGLFGALGAATAVLTGNLVDRGRVRMVTSIGALCMTLSFVAMHYMGSVLPVLIGSVIVVDASLQALNTSNQSIIYRIASNARSRINSGYMTSYFIGGATGSLMAGIAWRYGQWATTTKIGVVLSLSITIVSLGDKISAGFSNPRPGSTSVTSGTES